MYDHAREKYDFFSFYNRKITFLNNETIKIIKQWSINLILNDNCKIKNEINVSKI